MSSKGCNLDGNTCPLFDGGRGRNCWKGESYLCSIWVPPVPCKQACKMHAVPELDVHIHGLDCHHVSLGMIKHLFYSTI